MNATAGIRLWVDDDRSAPEGWVVAKTSAQAIRILSSKKVDEISLDFSLAYMNIDTTKPVVQWMIDNYFPAVVHVHTGSPQGRNWLVNTINTHAPDRLGDVYSAPNF